jgi:hypothetical protein
MIPFSDHPPAADHGHGLPIRRTPAGRPLVGIITCDRLIGCNTHYFGGRTTPCTKPDCKACNAAIPWRWHGYITFLAQDDRQHCLFECTAQAAEELVIAQTTHGTLRWVKFEARRMSSKPNGRVLLRISPERNVAIPIPSEPNIPAVLAHLWGLPADAVEKGPRRQHTNGDDTRHLGTTDTAHTNPESVAQILGLDRSQETAPRKSTTTR